MNHDHGVPGAAAETDRSARAGGGVAAVRRALLLASATALAWGAPAGRAATQVSPFATVGVEHDSNVFMRPSGAPPFGAQGISALGDTLQRYEAGVDAKFDWGAQHLTLEGHGTRQRYDRFSFLDHTAYRFKGDWQWRLDSVFDGALSYVQRRYMATFADTLTTALLLDTERTAEAVLRVRVSPQWRVDLTPLYHALDTPLPSFPAFRQQERGATAALQYLGFGKLTAGVRISYTRGRYAGIVGATRYRQQDADLTADYAVSGFSSFSASAGYTRRDTQPNAVDSVVLPGYAADAFAGYTGVLGRTSIATGQLSYSRRFSGKTRGYLSVFRRVDSYTAGANPEIATGGAIGARWRADARWTLHVDYSLTREQIRGGLVVANVTGRSDRLQWARVQVRYALWSWITVQPYVIWEQEHSSVRLGNYTATRVGIELTARMGR